MSDSAEPSLVHAVFFELRESNRANRDALVSGCRRYLAHHPGVLHFSAGCRAENYARPVNDRDFDVALVMVFASQADHDRYQIAPDHQKFIAEFVPVCSRVRVFDSFSA